MHNSKPVFWYQGLFLQPQHFQLSDQYQEIPLHSINLIALDEWYDLISLHKYADPGETLQIKPYEFVWITNYTARN